MAIATTPSDNALTPNTENISGNNNEQNKPQEETTKKRDKPLSNLKPSPIGQGLSVESFKLNNLKNSLQQMLAQPAVKKTLPALIVFFILLIFVSIFSSGEFFKPTTYRLLMPGINESEKQLALETLNVVRIASTVSP